MEEQSRIILVDIIKSMKSRMGNGMESTSAILQMVIISRLSARMDKHMEGIYNTTEMVKLFVNKYMMREQ